MLCSKIIFFCYLTLKITLYCSPTSYPTKLGFFSFLILSRSFCPLYSWCPEISWESVYVGLFSFNGFYTFNLRTHVFLISEKFIYITPFIFFPPILKFHLSRTSCRWMLDSLNWPSFSTSPFKISFPLCSERCPRYYSQLS